MGNSKWVFDKENFSFDKSLKGLPLPKPILYVLLKRNLKTEKEIRSFLYPSVLDIHPPSMLKDIDKAVERILKAVERKEKILIFGDYDVDGITGTVILLKLLSSIGGNVDFYIPDRIKEGYGIKRVHAEILERMGAKLVITVDTGIKSFEFVDFINSRNIDVIITDHHLPEDSIPSAFAVINPLQKDCTYPFKGLAGVGVAFKLVQAILERTEKKKFIPRYLMLVAIGTIADLAELTGENRVFVKIGLEELSNPYNKGLRYLLEVSGLSEKKVSVNDISFRIGPRLNASGRLSSARKAVDLFLSEEPEECRRIAEELDRLNVERQRVEEEILKEAISLIPEKNVPKILLLFKEGWHRGVIGIVASKLVEKFRRPSILVTIEDEKGYGSGRSIESFHLASALRRVSHLFESWGGHKIASGFVIKKERVGELISSLSAYADEVLSDEDFARKIKIDSFLDFKEIDLRLLEILENNFPPFGIGNPKPVFATRKVRIERAPEFLKGDRLLLSFSQNGIIAKGVIWDYNEKEIEPDMVREGGIVSIAYHVEREDYAGEVFPTLNILDVKNE
ncbi:MAG: single-stranded-DNA-specific exonuclease RecJ [Candidatus Aminicenantia bacterium]